MNDKQMLELAVKAAGCKTKGLASKHVAQGVSDHALLIENERGGDSVFDPLTDDGDALRLAVKLQVSLNFEDNGALGLIVEAITPEVDGRSFCHTELQGENPEKATRRAITRAAAEIGVKL